MRRMTGFNAARRLSLAMVGLAMISAHVAHAQTSTFSDLLVHTQNTELSDTAPTKPAVQPAPAPIPIKPLPSANAATAPTALSPAAVPLVPGGQSSALQVARSTAAAPSIALSPVVAAPVPLSPTAATLAPNLDQIQQQLTQLQAQVQSTTDDSKLEALRNQFAAAQAQVGGVVSTQSKDLATVDKQLAQLTPAVGRHKETADERRQRALLVAKRVDLANSLQRAQTVEAAASSAYDLAAERRRNAFSARVFKQSASPLSPEFWTSLQASSGTDIGRLWSAAGDEVNVAMHARQPLAALALAVALALGLAILFPLRHLAERFGRSTRQHVGDHNFSISARAIWIAIVDTAAPSLAATLLHLGAQWGGLLSTRAEAMAHAMVVAVTWGAAILALGQATVGDEDRDSRLIPVRDEAVPRIRAYLWIVAVITGAGFLLTQLNDVVGASLAATVAANCALSVAYVTVAALILVSFGKNRGPDDGESDSRASVQSSSAWTLVTLALSVAIIVTLAALFTGYTTLAVLISGQIFWLSVLALATYLVLRFVDDLCAVLFRRQGWAARTLFTLFSLSTSTIDQLGVLVSAMLQLVILIAVLSLALTPFGQSGNVLISHLGQIGHAIHIGSATISPKAVAAGLASLVIGIGLAHLVRGWVERRYLPATDWDSGVRNSVSTGVGYVGVAIALLCALSAMGLGFKQIALVASALSVGIGFGLQQVVQNFVSGVILLIERPVKVGDWVNIGGLEGDVRSIRVRATEIQTFDRTTLIVPNSDLITKTVQNKTLGDPHGRIQLQLSIANSIDARRAESLIFEVAKARTEILLDPEPKVFIDSLTSGGAVNFNCYLYVASPRDVYKTKSALYFDILDVFIKENVPFLGATVPQDVIVQPGPALQTLMDSAANWAPAPRDDAVAPPASSSQVP